MDTLNNLNPGHIYTDKLNLYKNLLGNDVHRIYPRCTNHIERNNLTLRIWLKRLGRKTLCFTKSAKMLENCMCLLASGSKLILR
ncbi:MAG: IS1 family transposase [Bacteroidales bacterium]|nr:IS1 family transposase [Bacteroidales bacterium]